MTTADILNAAADRIEAGGWDPTNPELSVSGAIAQSAPDALEAVSAINAFLRLIRGDGFQWERQIGRTPEEVVRALRDAAAAEAS